MEKIELCGVARAFVQISENGLRSKKFGHPCTRLNLMSLFLSRVRMKLFHEKKEDVMQSISAFCLELIIEATALEIEKTAP